MKTPTIDDQKPKREKLGPTGPAKVSSDEDKEKNQADGSYEKELEHILDRKRGETPPS